MKAVSVAATAALVALCGVTLAVHGKRITPEYVDDQIDAVVLTADTKQPAPSVVAGARTSRQFIFNYPRIGPVLTKIPLSQECNTSQGLAGRCMTLNRCYPKRKIFRLPAHETWAMGLYNTCGIESARGIQVYGTCCPNDKAKAQAIGDSSSKRSKNRKSSTPCLLNNDQKSSVTNSRCKVNNGGQTKVRDFLKIVGGVQAIQNEYKFIAALLAQDSTGRLRQFCGGSLVDRYHILTAAHCVIGYTESDINMLRVRLGAHSLSSSGGSSEHRVDRIIRHIKFNTNNLDYDVAILTLREPAPIDSNSNIDSICLPSINNDYVNFEAIVAGWGALQASGATQPDTLRKVKVEVWTNSACSSSYGSDAPGGITDRMLCANLPSKDSCQGDSGGPLFTCDIGNQRCTQVGIVSWGISCAKSQYPGVYSRVTALKDWIDRITSCY